MCLYRNPGFKAGCVIHTPLACWMFAFFNLSVVTSSKKELEIVAFVCLLKTPNCWKAAGSQSVQAFQALPGRNVTCLCLGIVSFWGLNNSRCYSKMALHESGTPTDLEFLQESCVFLFPKIKMLSICQRRVTERKFHFLLLLQDPFWHAKNYLNRNTYIQKLPHP